MLSLLKIWCHHVIWKSLTLSFPPLFDAANVSRGIWVLECLIPIYTAQIPDKCEVSGSVRGQWFFKPSLPTWAPLSPGEGSQVVSGEQEQCLHCWALSLLLGWWHWAQSHPSLGVPAFPAGCSPRVSEQPAGPMWSWHVCLLFMEMGASQRARIPVEMGGERKKGKKTTNAVNGMFWGNPSGTEEV